MAGYVTGPSAAQLTAVTAVSKPARPDGIHDLTYAAVKLRIA